jgi:chemotaxis response regulator CheB
MNNRDIIAIGGSAGATAPLKQILSRLPSDLPAAVFVVLHIPSRGLGILSTVASSAGPLPVRQAEHGMPIENGHVYIAAPDHTCSCSKAASCWAAVRAKTWFAPPSIRCSARRRCITARG